MDALANLEVLNLSFETGQSTIVRHSEDACWEVATKWHSSSSKRAPATKFDRLDEVEKQSWAHFHFVPTISFYYRAFARLE